MVRKDQATLLLFLLQAPIEFDLARVTPVDGCRGGAAGSAGEIVVCARKRDAPVPDLPAAEQGMGKAEIGLFGDVRGGVSVSRSFVGGFPSDRVMVTVRVPF